jgi:hypothetical protein
LLTIYQPEKVKINGKVRLQAQFDVDGIEDVLWYETSEEYGPYMATERVDAFLVGLLWLALKKTNIYWSKAGYRKNCSMR